MIGWVGVYRWLGRGAALPPQATAMTMRSGSWSAAWVRAPYGTLGTPRGLGHSSCSAVTGPGTWDPGNLFPQTTQHKPWTNARAHFFPSEWRAFYEFFELSHQRACSRGPPPAHPRRSALRCMRHADCSLPLFSATGIPQENSVQAVT